MTADCHPICTRKVLLLLLAHVVITVPCFSHLSLPKCRVSCLLWTYRLPGLLGGTDC